MEEKKCNNNVNKGVGICIFFVLAAFLLVGQENVYSKKVIDNPDLVRGELWNYTGNSTQWLFDLDTVGDYHALTNLSNGNTKGFNHLCNSTHEGGSLLITQYSGYYKVNLHISARPTKNSLYSFAVGVNNIPQRDCYARGNYQTGSVAVGSISCIIKLNKGDTVQGLIEQESTPLGNIYIHTVNLNLIKIGNLK